MFNSDLRTDAQIRRGLDRIAWAHNLLQKSKCELAESEAKYAVRKTKDAETEMCIKLQRWAIEELEKNFENLKAGASTYTVKNLENQPLQ